MLDIMPNPLIQFAAESNAPFTVLGEWGIFVERNQPKEIREKTTYEKTNEILHI
jgi:hypothetical protein